MVETVFLRELIVSQRPVMIRLTEGRDIAAVVLGQDSETLLVQRPQHVDERSLIYKRSISVITPSEEQKPDDKHTNEQPAAWYQPAGDDSGRGGGKPPERPVPRH